MELSGYLAWEGEYGHPARHDLDAGFSQIHR